MKIFYISFSFIICFFVCNITISRSQTGCNLAAIRAAFAALGHYTELTGVTVDSQNTITGTVSIVRGGE